MSNFIWAVSSFLLAAGSFVMATGGNVWMWYVAGSLWTVVAVMRLYMWSVE